jgi:hypothetical protein
VFPIALWKAVTGLHEETVMAMAEASIASPSGEWTNPALQDPATSPSSRLTAALVVLYVVVLAIAVAATMGVQGPPWEKRADWLLPTFIGFLASFLLSIIPIAICKVHAQARKRQHSRLMSIPVKRVRDTINYRLADVALRKSIPVCLSREYSGPMLTFTAVILIFWLVLLLSSYAIDSFSRPCLILAGMKLMTAPEVADAPLAAYQRGTFVLAGVAFIGAYVYTLGRLLDRLNNNDLYPISFYYYTVRLVVAFLIAVVVRHSAAVFTENTQLLVLLAFAIGLAPDLFILAMARKAFQTIKVFGHKSDPKRKTRPTALPLLMIDDLTKDKVDRLNELGIDSAQVLACQNPFTIWPRLPYDLGLVVDWIATAQLYDLVKEQTLQALRTKFCVRNIFDLHVRLVTPGSRPEICAALGIQLESAEAVIKQLEEDQSFYRLKELRDALRENPEASDTTSSHEASCATMHDSVETARSHVAAMESDSQSRSDERRQAA